MFNDTCGIKTKAALAMQQVVKQETRILENRKKPGI